MENLTDGIHRIGHACFRLDLAKRIYIDPYQLTGDPQKADVIICTHSHYDHCSPEDIAKIRTDETVMVATPDCVEKIGGSVRTIAPGETVELDTIRIEAVPAYNTNKSFHPRANAWVGVIIDDGERRIYHTGDSDAIPEMKDARADVWLIPVSGTYVMDAEEAAALINELKPQVAVPMHYGAIVGSSADADKFASLVGDRARIL